MIKKLFITGIMLAGSLMGLTAQSLPVYLDGSKPIEERVEDALSRMTLAEKIAVIHAQSKFSSPGVKRLGIPEFRCDDGPHGVRAEVLWDAWTQANQSNDSVVAFPALTCLAASWNTEMPAIYGRNLSEEALYRGKSMMLGPGVNIYRTPLNGRNFEYMGEDPYLSSRMVIPYIETMQENGVSACVKHFALNNNEQDRHNNNVTVSDRALHEIYLPAFKAAVTEAKTWGIMGAYNLYDNYHLCHNPYILMDILKKQWNYDGVVVSDWGGVHNTEQAIKYGMDMEFGTHTDGLTVNTPNAFEKYYLAKPYRDLIQQGKVGQDELNDKVRRVLRLFFRTNLNTPKTQGSLCSESHYAAAEKIAEDGIVLLKNDKNLLPVNTGKVKKLLVVGENAIKMMTLGGGSSQLKAQYEISPLNGLKKELAGKVQIEYARGYASPNAGPQDGMAATDISEKRSAAELTTEAVEKAGKADLVIFFGGLNKNKGQDCEGQDRKDFDLPYNQSELVSKLAAANPNLVFVSISGNATALPFLAKVPAMVQGWYLGSQAGEALAKVLCGEVNPSGKMPFSWGAKLNDYGAHALGTYPGTKRNDGSNIVDQDYKEGIYVGYRWMDKEKVRPLFAFGHGLSYTSFKIGNLQADKKEISQNEPITFTVNVQNTGKMAGAEVVQLYIHDVKASVDRPYKELKGFRKVFLQPGESKSVSITVNKDALSFYDGKTHSWKAETGDFEALIGNSSDNITAKVKFSLK